MLKVGKTYRNGKHEDVTIQEKSPTGFFRGDNNLSYYSDGDCPGLPKEYNLIIPKVEEVAPLEALQSQVTTVEEVVTRPAESFHTWFEVGASYKDGRGYVHKVIGIIKDENFPIKTDTDHAFKACGQYFDDKVSDYDLISEKVYPDGKPKYQIGLSFGGALTALEEGKRVRRLGWNGKGLWLYLQKPDAHSKMTLPYIYIEYPANAERTPGARVPWLASQTDLLAKDWLVDANMDG